MILTSSSSISRNLGDILQSRGISSNPWWPSFALKWIQQNFLKLTFELLGRSRASLHFKTERIAETALRVSSFWQPLSPFSLTYRIFSSALDSNLASARLCLQWNWHRKTFWTVTFEPLGRNIAPLHFKTERLAETALRTWWFSQTSAKFPGIWGIFSTPWVSKLIPDGFGLQLNAQSVTF